LNHDLTAYDYYPTVRKCTWALADIGTEEAKSYLQELTKSKDTTLAGYAYKRLNSWEAEMHRKGRFIPSPGSHKNRIKIEPYSAYTDRLPHEGSQIIAYHRSDEIVVYQAYKPSIAAFSVKNQQLGGPAFSYGRMSWIKPNFLWMMFRSGWAEKKDQERILAIWIKKADWEEILSHAVHSSYDEKIYEDESSWKQQLQHSEIRLQWDPDHDPYGEKLQRRAIQIGIKGKLLKKFGTEYIQRIQDITAFVRKQKLLVDHHRLDLLEIPQERVYLPERKDINIGISPI
jgi:hypothetical protein